MNILEDYGTSLRKKRELEWKYNGYDKCSEDDDTDDSCTCSSLASSGNTRGTGAGTDNNEPIYEKIKEMFEKNLKAIEERPQFQRWLQSLSFPQGGLDEAKRNSEAEAETRQFEQIKEERKQKIEKEQKRKIEEDKLEKLAWKFCGLYNSDDDTDEDLDAEIVEMLRQQYEEDQGSDNFSCSSSEWGTDSDDDNGNFIYNEEGVAIIEEIQKAYVKFEEFLKVYEKEGNKPCYWWVINQQKRAAVEMLRFLSSQCIRPVVQQRHIIE